MIEPSSFAVHVTYTCPLACAHCCFKSSPKNKDRLDPDRVIATIEHLDVRKIRMVAFTGGEPMLLGKHLVEFVRLANARGFVTRIVTSGYFGTTIEAAETRLRELVNVGLDELSISWDDFHAAFVRFETVKNVVRAAKKFKELTVAVNVVQAKQSEWNSDRVRQELGLDREVVCESPLNLTGRAEQELHEAGFRNERFLGPCPYILTGPTLSAKNKLLACCGVIPETERLVIDSSFSPENLTEDLEQAKKSILFNWLYLRGPYAIMKWMSEHYGVQVPDRLAIGGNCQACKHLFETPEIESLIDKAIVDKGPEVMGEVYLLESLGLLEPKSVLAIWAKEGAIHE